VKSKTNAITYVFRRPRCPFICAIDGDLIGAKSLAGFQRRLARFDLSRRREFKLIDARGESWTLLPDEMVLAPEFMIRKWRKLDIIRLFNESRTAKRTNRRYPEDLIPSRPLARIVHDLVELLANTRYRDFDSRHR
jgi:hypothetical protein